jgi:hypothetical protein
MLCKCIEFIENLSSDGKLIRRGVHAERHKIKFFMLFNISRYHIDIPNINYDSIIVIGPPSARHHARFGNGQPTPHRTSLRRRPPLCSDESAVAGRYKVCLPHNSAFSPSPERLSIQQPRIKIRML